VSTPSSDVWMTREGEGRTCKSQARKGAHDRGRITEEPCEVETLMHGSEAETGGAIPSPTVTGRGKPRRSAWAVCAVHAVMLGDESPPSRCPWSRRTREAQGRHREVGSEGRVERTCGARDTNRIRGVVQSGRAGTQQPSPPSTTGLCFIHPASLHGRYDSLPREICGVSWTGLRGEQSSLTALQKSAEGIVGPAQARLVRHPKAERRSNG